MFSTMLFLFLFCAFSNDVKVVPSNQLCSSGACNSQNGTFNIGAEIIGITDFSTLTEDDISTIRQALVDHGVIYFKGVAHLFNPEIQLSFASKFGDVLPEISRVPQYVEKGVHQSLHSVRHDERTGVTDITNSLNTMVEANKKENKMWKGESMPDRVARLVREPGDPFAFGEGYHADVTFFEKPPVFTFLVARELPGGLDDTYYLNVNRAYETLPEEIKFAITGLNAVHNDSAGLVSVHPVVRTHSESGKQSLYVNSHFTRKIVGFDETEGKKLLDLLFDHLESMPVFKFKWTCDVEACGTECPECLHALMWDNRWLQHTATTDWARDERFNFRRRELHRVTISADERPYYRPVLGDCLADVNS